MGGELAKAESGMNIGLRARDLEIAKAVSIEVCKTEPRRKFWHRGDIAQSKQSPKMVRKSRIHLFSK